MSADEVQAERRDAGAWQNFGAAAGAQELGLWRVRLAPGARSAAPHRHPRGEELIWVVSGEGTSWQDGCTWQIGATDAVFHPPAGPQHALGAGPEGMEVLAFSSQPRLEHIFEEEGERGDERQERPETIVALWDVFDEREEHGEHAWIDRDVGRALPCREAGLRHQRIEPGHRGVPLHCHAGEEELFVILGGTGTLELGLEETVPVGPGDVISRPAGTGVGHAFLASGDGVLEVLAYGQRKPDETVYYPRSEKILFAGIGLMTRIEGRLDFWDGEP